MNMQTDNTPAVRTNSVRAWLLAARPKTLSAAAVPVLIGVALAYRSAGWGGFGVLPAVLCLLFAWFMQIDSNLINDYFDYVRGRDDRDTRLGPARACASGWVTLPAMRWAMGGVSLVACAVGLPLIAFGGWWLVAVGAVCVLFAFLYTTFFASRGLGDVLVLVFFGLVPVYFTWYVVVPPALQGFDGGVLLAAGCCGLVVDTLLLVNNYRDLDVDRACGKITLAVRLGHRATRRLYLWLPFVAEALLGGMLFVGSDGGWLWALGLLLMSVYLCLHVQTARTMAAIGRGKALNRVLGLTARNIFIFGLVSVLQILLVSLFP